MVTAIPYASTVKIKYDCGLDLDTQKRKYKTRAYSSIKSTATNDDIMAFVNVVVGLQQDTLDGTTLISVSALEE